MRRFSFYTKNFAVAAAMVLMIPYCSHAYSVEDYYHCTREKTLIQALTFLEKSTAKASVPYLVNNRVHIVFKPMRELGKTYRGHDALSIISNNGHHIIYISSKHSNAPAPALAALISHEVMHSDVNNSVQEEVTAWNQEARCWKEMLEFYPELRSIKPGTIPLVDRLNAVLVLVDQNRLNEEIKNNVAYQGLPERSPGF